MKKLVDTFKDVQIYSNGIVHCSVCALKTLSKKEVEAEVNRQNMTGISSAWHISKDNFKDGTKNPNQCENDKNRLHYLMVC